MRSGGSAVRRLVKDYITGRVPEIALSPATLVVVAAGLRKPPEKLSTRHVVAEMLRQTAAMIRSTGVMKQLADELEAAASQIEVKALTPLGALAGASTIIASMLEAAKSQAHGSYRHEQCLKLLQELHAAINPALAKFYEISRHLLTRLTTNEHRLIVTAAHVAGSNWLTRLAAETITGIEIPDKLAPALALIDDIREQGENPHRELKLKKTHLVDTIRELLENATRP